jgi:hypothetical protein
MIRLREFLSEPTSTFCIFFLVGFPCKRCVLGDVFAQIAPALHDENIADLVSGPAARFKRRT